VGYGYVASFAGWTVMPDQRDQHVEWANLLDRDSESPLQRATYFDRQLSPLAGLGFKIDHEYVARCAGY
jgi:hypothetical protein